MKKSKQILSSFFVASLLGASSAFGQTAEIQIIHNSADPAAAVVDVYVNGTIALDDFAFRTATGFLTLPAGVQLEIGVAGGNSTSVNDTIKNFSVTLAAGQRYVALANGVLNTAAFAANPDNRPTAFTLFVKDNIQAAAMMPGNVDFVAVHGASDAPAVDIIARNVATLVNDASYGDITNYIAVPAGNYLLDVTPAAGSPIVASFQADLTALGGGTAVVFASGFLNPAANQNGEAFGLFAALASGQVVPLPATSLARVQLIHNAADPAAAVVDIYINGNLALNDVAFRTATPFLDAPAGVPLNIGVAPGNSTSAIDTLKNFEVTLANGGSYLAVANGVLNPANFAPNPDGNSTAFTLFISDMMREASTSAGVDFRVVHGASDAPTVDVIARNVATLVNDAPYGATTGYITVPAGSYLLDVTPAAGSPIVATFQADLTALGGGAAVVFASGFLNPAANQNGAAFGLFAALPSGQIVTLPSVAKARLQVIHNAADPAAATVDVYVNGGLALDDFGFRKATPYIEVDANVALNIGVAGGNSTSVNDTLKNFTVTLENGKNYIAVATGVLNPANFAANPDAISTAFTLLLQSDMRLTANNPAEVDLRVIHGASDAPTVDVLANGGVLVDNAPYTAITGYLNVPAASYILSITPGNNNTAIVASFLADITSIPGQSAVVLASGFLTPSANQNGAAFGLIGVLADGTVITFGNVTNIDEANENINNVFPNPASDVLNVTFKEQVANNTTITIVNAIGQNVITETISAGTLNHQIDVKGLSKGIYSMSINNGNSINTRKFSVQ